MSKKPSTDETLAKATAAHFSAIDQALDTLQQEQDEGIAAILAKIDAIRRRFR